MAGLWDGCESPAEGSDADVQLLPPLKALSSTVSKTITEFGVPGNREQQVSGLCPGSSQIDRYWLA